MLKNWWDKEVRKCPFFTWDYRFSAIAIDYLLLITRRSRRGWLKCNALIYWSWSATGWLAVIAYCCGGRWASTYLLVAGGRRSRFVVDCGMLTRSSQTALCCFSCATFGECSAQSHKLGIGMLRGGVNRWMNNDYQSMVSGWTRLSVVELLTPPFFV